MNLHMNMQNKPWFQNNCHLNYTLHTIW